MKNEPNQKIQIRPRVNQGLIELLDYEYINTGKFASLSEAIEFCIQQFLTNNGHKIPKADEI